MSVNFKSDNERIFFSSDHHFGHENVIRFCARPYSSVEEMDADMVKRWNEVVGPEDRVFYLGDFAMRMHPRRLREVFDSLNGIKSFIPGNHDKGPTWGLPWDEPPQPYREIFIDGTRVTLCHYALRTWRDQRRGGVMLYGHSHGKLPGNSQSLDVGVDCWDYRPAEWREIKSRLETLPKHFESDSAS